MSKNMIVQKINSCYVADDCIQIMLPYKKGITVLNTKGILYHDYKNTNNFINNYLDDERRNKFPYSDIPMHRELLGLRGIYNFTNQIFEFDKTYLRFFDGNVVENYVVKDGKEALLVSKIPSIYGERRILNSSEFEQLFDEFAFYDENTYYLLENGVILDTDDKHTISSSKILYETGLKSPIWKIQFVDGKIIINGIHILFTSRHAYEQFIVETYDDVIFGKYNLERLKYLSSKIKSTSIPNISPILNPNISKEVIEKNKTLVKSYR